MGLFDVLSDVVSKGSSSSVRNSYSGRNNIVAGTDTGIGRKAGKVIGGVIGEKIGGKPGREAGEVIGEVAGGVIEK